MKFIAGSEKKPNTNLGMVLKKWRLMNDLSIRDAARRVGISHPTYARIEWGYAMDAKTMMVVLNWLMSLPEQA